MATRFQKAPKRAFVVHGEPVAADGLAQALRHDLGWPTVMVPEHRESDILFTGT
ncbi:MAG: MBL fold metallo-hydrolase RNA specificity domain-containing protein [Hymenobacter sp.]